MIIWDSESGMKENVTSGKCHGTVMIDKKNGVFRISDYEMDGNHCTVMMFFGPDSDKNYDKWQEWVSNRPDSDHNDPNINTDTAAAIKKCFDL